jgi:ferritin
MLSDKIEQAFNEQANKELYSAYLYFSMSNQLDAMNLKGFAHWMRVQAQEEMTHAFKFYGHIQERQGRAKVLAIDAPPLEWDSPLAIFEAAYEHEQKVTALINGLVKLARDEQDNAAEFFLQWFVTEQVEEEASADEVVQKLRLIGDAKGPLFMLDNVMGQRGAGGSEG